MEGRYKVTSKREFKLPWRKAGLLISMIKWTRTSRLSIKISLSRGWGVGFRVCGFALRMSGFGSGCCSGAQAVKLREDANDMPKPVKKTNVFSPRV